MNFQAYNKLLISDEDIHLFKPAGVLMGFEFRIQYPSYRGTFLSCIEELKVFVDDNEIPQNKVYFLLNGKQFLLSQLAELYDEYWFVLDKATLRIMDDTVLEQGKKHKVAVSMLHRIPYAGYSGSYLKLNSTDTKLLKVC